MSTETTPTGDGRVVWHDLMTTDPDKARAFYSELFGWTTDEMDMGSGAGAFKYQIHRWYENRIVYMRWSVAWLFAGLSRLARALGDGRVE